MLAAGDTFRAAASEQLETWASRAGVPIVKRRRRCRPRRCHFDTVKSATARGYDLVIADTAGRLHNKSNLMDELAKISRSVKKASPEASLETLLVLDAITGPERHQSGQGVLQGCRCHRHHPDQAGRHRQGRLRWWRSSSVWACRCALSAWARASTTCCPSPRRALWKSCSRVSGSTKGAADMKILCSHRQRRKAPRAAPHSGSAGT